MIDLNVMLDAYTIRPVRVINPNSKSYIIFETGMSIKVNPITHIAWMEEFQVKLSRHSYMLVQ